MTFDDQLRADIRDHYDRGREDDGLDAVLDDPASREVLMRWLRLLESEPSLVGASPHLLGLATRPESAAVVSP